MTKVLVSEENLQNIADAIRTQNGSNETYNPTEMAQAILSISSGSDSIPVGVMLPYGNETPPKNWLFCDGREVSRTEYADLFAVIGTKYGAGDGSTTFNLPNKKGKVSVGLDSSDTDFNAIGKTGGEKTHTLTINEIPSHNHTVEKIATFGHSSGVNFGTSGDWLGNPTVYTNSTGGGQPHNNLQPYQVDNWIIKAVKEESTNPNDYSIEETFTGKHWIDGKKIYKKTITGITSTGTKSHNISNFGEVTDFYGHITKSTGKQEPIPRMVLSNPEVYGIAIGDISSTGFYIEFGSNYTNVQKGVLTLEYTKTTD